MGDPVTVFANTLFFTQVAKKRKVKGNQNKLCSSASLRKNAFLSYTLVLKLDHALREVAHLLPLWQSY